MKLLSFFVWLLSTYCGVWRSARVACALCAMVWLLACTLQPTEHQLLCRRIDKLEERVFWEIQDLKALILQNQGYANSPTQNRTSSLPPQSLPQSAPRVIAHTRSGKSS